MCYVHRSGILYGARINAFSGQNCKNKPSKPKNGIWVPKISMVENFMWSKNKNKFTLIFLKRRR
jgi:hypothetical protein